MTLPKMKIWTGGDQQYCARVQRALFEYGNEWVIDGLEVRNFFVQAIYVDAAGFISYSGGGGYFNDDRRPAYRLTPTGKLVPAEADDEGWIANKEMSRPTPGEERVHVWFRDGTVSDREKANMWIWDNTQDRKSIIAYRVPSRIFQTSQKERDMKEQTSCEQSTPTDPRDPEFWRDAPEGATHWIPPSPASSDVDKGVFAKKVDGQWMGWAGTRWKAIPDADGRTFGKSVEQVAIPRPEPENPEWDGEGLPPVGTVCEVVSPNTGTSSRIRIVAHGETMLLADIEGQGESPLMKGRNFRPLRPHRERVIDEAMSVSGPYIDSRATAEKMAGALYDAGMLHLSEDKDG
jgi:hypothetical protein